jgi:hypothetical protein
MYLYIAIAVGGALLSTVALLSFFPSLINTNTMDYALDVDAFVDNDGTMLIYRVVISNIGRYDITDVSIDYVTYKEFIPIIRVGEKVMLSPNENANKDHVIIDAKPNIHIVKEYRSLPKMVKAH